MLSQRLLSFFVILPVGLVFIALGGWPFLAFVILVAIGAAWEYGRLFIAGGFRPAMPLIIGTVLLLVVARAVDGFGQWSDAILTIAVLVSMGWHVFAYQRCEDTAGTDFAIDLSSMLYLGWIGAYLISLRMLPGGGWKLLLALATVWVADAAAYFVGRKFGKHKIAPRVSPGKSWEGVFGSIVFAPIGGGILALLMSRWSPDLTFPLGALLGLLLAVITPLGDFGESMIKRQFGMKDSSNLIPGHGGILDRIDTWLWAGVIAYYMFRWLS
jgi:phosphatidate cytidylyltransferase